VFRWCLHCFGGGDVGASRNSEVGELLVHADVDSSVERHGRDQERLEARQAVLFDRFAQLADSVLDRRRQAVVEVGFSLVASLERRSWKVRALGEVVAVGKWTYGATESWSCALSKNGEQHQMLHFGTVQLLMELKSVEVCLYLYQFWGIEAFLQTCFIVDLR
jgi:hypothetical protein